MIGCKVFHNIFGGGTITSIEGKILTVNFGESIKKFVYPDVFEKFLISTDSELMEQVNRDLRKKRARNIKTIRPIVQSNSIQQQIKRCKTEERSNIAFKCNYCDGGKTAFRIGFHGVCSDPILRYNIVTAKRVWCSDPDAPCKQYFEGKISRMELENMMECEGGFVCYESSMLRDWRASAGMVQNGVDRGKPRHLMKVQNNSLAVLTTREPNFSESSRFIFAVFLVDESYEGNHKDEGYVTTHSDWKIELMPAEAHKMKFWIYYANRTNVIAFSSGLFRYLTDIQAAQILRDIAQVRLNQTDRVFAGQFFEHFCKIKGINAADVPMPCGALHRSD